jgi:spore coat protein CotH
MNSNDLEFKLGIGNIIELNNFIDYYILLNLLSMDDNRGKNTFYKKTQNGKITIIPWDMDGTNGIYWNGNLKATNLLVTNNLFTRLIENDPENFKSKLKTRWSELRSTILLFDNLISHLEAISYPLKQSDIISLENEIWGININHKSEIDHIKNWLFHRVIFLDEYFNSL